MTDHQPPTPTHTGPVLFHAVMRYDHKRTTKRTKTGQIRAADTQTNNNPFQHAPVQNRRKSAAKLMRIKINQSGEPEQHPKHAHRYPQQGREPLRSGPTDPQHAPTIHPPQHPAEGRAASPVRTAEDRPGQRRTIRPTRPDQHTAAAPDQQHPDRTSGPTPVYPIPAQLAAPSAPFLPKNRHFLRLFCRVTRTIRILSTSFCPILCKSCTFCTNKHTSVLPVLQFLIGPANHSHKRAT